jgi:carbonic anhydrase
MSPHPSPPQRAAESPEKAIALLKAGNERFASGQPNREPVTARLLELTAGQRPFAIILGCSDSRVPSDTIFDQAPGHLFTVRVAGNFVDEDGLGSIEYGIGIAAQYAPLILVKGHSACGAVSATIEYVKNGTLQPSYIMNLVRALEPSVRAARPLDSRAGDLETAWLDRAIERNVRDNMNAIAERSPLVAEAVKSKAVAVAGAIYDLHSGRVRFLSS